MKKKRKYIIVAVIIIAVATAGIFYFTHNRPLQKELRKDTATQPALNDARKLMNTSPQKAYVLTMDLLQKAMQVDNKKLTADCQIIIGKIQSIQGKNSDALASFKKALLLSGSISYTYGICNANLEIGIINYIWGNYDESYNYFANVLRLAEMHKFIYLQAKAIDYIGKYYHTTGNFAKSIEFYEKSVNIYKELGDSSETAAVLLSLGKTYVNKGNLHMGLQCYLDAYKACQKSKNYVNFASICNHLGTINLALGQPQKSLDYHRQALNYRVMLKYPQGMAASYNNIGETFLALNQTDSARINFKKSLEYCLQAKYKKGTVKTLTNLGIVEERNNNHSEATNYFTRSLVIAKESGYDAGIAEASLALGKTMLAQKIYNQAIAAFEQSLEKSKSSNHTEFLPDIYNGLYQCYYAKNDLEKALQYHLLLSGAEKKLMKAENDRQLAELRVTFDSEKKEKDNQVLRKENELKEMTIQRKNAFMWLTIAAFMLAVVLCILIYSRFASKKKANRNLEALNKKVTDQNRKLEMLNEELEEANLEKDKILSIIAHELRNPLYWFQNLAEVLSKRYHSLSADKVQKSLSALDESAKNAFHLMDNLLHWSRSRLNRITPKYGVHSLEMLVNECTRMYDTILQHKEICLYADIPRNAKVNVDPDLFSVVVRNLVSNAIKYTPVKGIIDISCSENDNEGKYIVSISDSGIGIPVENIDALFDPGYQVSSPGLLQEKGSGFGLKLCKEFVELNRGEITVTSLAGKGTRFAFTVPKN